jgi:hypothetical protein
MPKNIQKEIKLSRNRNYLSRDFDSFRAELINYARSYFPEKISDFSEPSMGGMLLDFASFVGDSMSFYLDHQFNELNPLTAVEPTNIITHLRNAGVEIAGASPASVSVKVSISVPAETVSFSTGTEFRPKFSCLPIVLAGTSFVANNGTTFTLIEDLDFSQTPSGKIYEKTIDLAATAQILNVNSSGQPSTTLASPGYRLSLPGVCISGVFAQESFTLTQHQPFRRIVLGQSNITAILSVKDSDGNIYYEVGSLSQDVVFGGVPTIDQNGDVVKQDMEIIPASHRFIREMDPLSQITTIQFGAGRAETLDEDIIPDPSDLALPLYGKKTFSRFTIDPNSLLETHTLGIAPSNTTITFQYRYGGGLSHNVNSNTIATIDALNVQFRRNPSGAEREKTRASLVVTNTTPARGGLPAPALDELRTAIPSARAAQGRLVSRYDLTARIYTLPSEFGRVFRAAMSSNPHNPLSTTLYVISKDADNDLAVSSDALKLNLKKYLNEFRLVSDAVDIVDARILNFGVNFVITTHPSANKETVIQRVISKLQRLLRVDNFQINQPIVIGDIANVILNTDGVLTMPELPRAVSKFGIMEGREYAFSSFNSATSLQQGLMLGPLGSMFELKYPDEDIVGNAV